MRWDSWDALASKNWVRMEDSGPVDDEGRPILERVGLMEAFFADVHRQIYIMYLDVRGGDLACM